MTPDILFDAQMHANACHPRESCGVVVEVDGAGRYFPCANQSTDPDTFDLNPFDLADAEDAGRLVAYVHSHPDGPVTPSPLDHYSCRASGRPWFVVEAPGFDWTRIDPSRPYEGRRFVMGVDDCWSLVREWYARERGLALPDFLRSDKFWERGETPHLDHLSEAGFLPIPANDTAPGDGLIFHVMSKTVNHCGVYIGGGRFLHHLPNRLSIVEELGPWLPRLSAVVRHI